MAASIGRAGVRVLRVRGTRMQAEGILDGDLIVVEPASDPADGQTVVAGAPPAVGRLERRPGGIALLHSADPQTEPVVVPAEAIVGRVVALVRRYA